MRPQSLHLHFPCVRHSAGWVPGVQRFIHATNIYQAPTTQGQEPGHNGDRKDENLNPCLQRGVSPVGDPGGKPKKMKRCNMKF